jgi:hypothetical protein
MSNASDSSLTELDSDDAIRPLIPEPPPPSELKKRKPPNSPITKTVRVSKQKVTVTTSTSDTASTVEISQTEVEETTVTKPRRKRAKKETETMTPLAPRVASLLKIGAHVSAAKGVQNAVSNAVHIGYVPEVIDIVEMRLRYF